MLVLAMVAGCGAPDNQSATTPQGQNTTPDASPSPYTQTGAISSGRSGAGVATASPTVDAPLVSSAHGSKPSAPMSAVASNEKGEVDTAALDAKIERAEAKAKAKRAGEADKRAAATALFERGYVYYTAQNPRLYKFALGDFRRSLRYQPDNREAKEIIEQIESIYRSMNKPVPTNGLEP